MESSVYLALALGALNASADQRWLLAGLLAGSATLTRGDGLLIVGLVILSEALRRRRAPRRSALSAAILILPAMGLAALVYGSPFPATLRAKIMQASLGITGFFPGARFLDGLIRLSAAYLEQSGLYLLMLPLLAAGLAKIRAQRWAWPIVAWGALQLIGYTLLGVAPYRLPMVLHSAASGRIRLRRHRRVGHCGRCSASRPDGPGTRRGADRPCRASPIALGNPSIDRSGRAARRPYRHRRAARNQWAALSSSRRVAA
jgi:hypothetical protein